MYSHLWEQNGSKPSQEADWVMKAGEKIGKGLAAVGKGISNAMDGACSAVESAENFLNDCACEVSTWDWGWFDWVLDILLSGQITMFLLA